METEHANDTNQNHIGQVELPLFVSAMAYQIQLALGLVTTAPREEGLRMWFSHWSARHLCEVRRPMYGPYACRTSPRFP